MPVLGGCDPSAFNTGATGTAGPLAAPSTVAQQLATLTVSVRVEHGRVQPGQVPPLEPVEWKPPSRDFWRSYAGDWVRVKVNDRLTATAAEQAALTDVLGTCP